MLEIKLLGAFSIKSGKKTVPLPSRAAQSLLAYLILNAGTSYRREKLAGQLWPDSTEEAARDYLRHALWRIRKALQSASPGTYLQADDLTIAFASSADYRLDATILARAGECKTADDLIEALSSYGGELLPGFYEDWVVLEREHLQSIFEREIGRLLDLLQETGRWPDVLQWAEKWIAFGQKPEPAYRALMSAHAANGDMSKVAATYERCIKTLREFGVEPSEQTTALYEDIKSGKLSTAGTPAVNVPTPKLAPTSNIPVPLTSFVGRERELKKIAELLATSRLLTLTGPGGVGKTRLAIRVVADAAKKFPDGAYWIGLSDLADPNLVPQEIAQSLRIREVPSEPLVQTLIAHLRSQRLLLVLDNCEHLIQACAGMAEKLLAGCPRLSILATSVEGLGLFNETIWQLPSLPLPVSDRESSLKELRAIESIRLFDERAAIANSTYTLNENNAADVSQICRRLDGIPLAIELAAARIKVLSVHEIASRLDDRFSLLTAGSRTAIPRHQTLRATIDWSHDLLTEPERVLLRRLSVFSGGFTLRAAEAVCSSGLAEGEILDLLGRLAGRSLIVVDSVAGVETRYHLLETIRHYALEKLVAAGEAPETRNRHLGFFLQMAEEAEPNIFGHESGTWFGRLHRELDNLRSAIDWAISSGSVQLALRVLGAIVYFWFAHGLPASEWNEGVHQALDRPEGRERTLARAKALNGIGFMIWADVDPVDRHAELEEALSIGTELGDPTTTATALRNLGLLQSVQGHYEAARRHFERSVEIWKNLGADGKLGWALTINYFGDVALIQGNEAEARSMFEEAALGFEDAGDLNFRAYAIRRLGILAWRNGDLQGAFSLCRQSLEMNEQVADPRGLCACLAGFVAIALRKGEVERAVVLAAAVENQLAQIGIALLVVDRAEFASNTEQLRRDLDPKALAKSRAAGAAMSLEAVIAYALKAAG